MKLKGGVKRLQLSKETLRSLTDTQLDRYVVGGGAGPDDTELNPTAGCTTGVEDPPKPPPDPYVSSIVLCNCLSLRYLTCC